MNKIITGDCIAIMDTIPPASANLIVTSPPYPGQKGCDLTVGEWCIWFSDVVGGIKQVLHKNGVAVIVATFKRKESGWFDDRIFRIFNIFANHGMNAIDMYIWNKPNPVPNGARGRVDTPSWEACFVFTKAKDFNDFQFNQQYGSYAAKSITSSGGLYTGKDRGRGKKKPNHDGACLTNVITASHGEDQKRPRAKGISFPPSIPKRFILQYTAVGDVVLDPFCGVGTTCRQAQILRRDWIGIEIDDSEARKARKWLAEPAAMPLDIG